MPDEQIINGYTATPEQLKQLRNYSDELLKGSLARDSGSYVGVASHLLQGLLGNQKMNQANEMQIKALQDYGSQWGQAAQQGPGNYAPALIGNLMANPMGTPEQKGFAQSLMAPSALQDVHGRQGYITPAQGVVAAPANDPNFTQGYRAPSTIGPEGASTTIPFLAPPQGGPQRAAQPPSNPMAPMNNFVQGVMPTINTLSGNAAKNAANTEIIKQDTAAANDALTVQKFARTMSDLLDASDGVTFGPGNQLSNEVKKGLVNFAPQLGSIFEKPVAIADAIQKISASMAPALARMMNTSGHNTDANLSNTIMSIPSLHNSVQGAKALATMVDDTAQTIIGANRYAAQDPVNYQKRKAEFLGSHPTINPLTGKSILVDISESKLRQKAIDKNGPNFTPVPTDRYRVEPIR